MATAAIPRTAVLTHFCEQHGPSIVFATQKIDPESNVYSFPQSFTDLRPRLPGIMKGLSENIHFYSPSSSGTASPATSPQASPIPTRKNPPPLDKSSSQNAASASTASQIPQLSKESPAISVAITSSLDPKMAPSVTATPPSGSSPIVRRTSVPRDLEAALQKLKEKDTGEQLESDAAMELPLLQVTKEEAETEISLAPMMKEMEGGDAGKGAQSSEDSSPSPVLLKMEEDEVRGRTARRRGEGTRDEGIIEGESEEQQNPRLLKSSSGVRVSSSRSRSPSIEVSLKPNRSQDQKDEAQQGASSACAACSSVPEGNGLLSLDDDTNQFYMSTHVPSPNSYSAVRTACVRSLSCETCPGREGPVIFGSSEDPSKEWTFSYMFKLKDSKARGSFRSYSFLLLLSDYGLLVNIMELVTSFFQNIVTEMQQKAEKLHDREIEESKCQQQQSVSYLTPVRTYGMFRRAGATVPRSIPELTEEEGFFFSLHSKFCWILRNIDKAFMAVNDIRDPIKTLVPLNYEEHDKRGFAFKESSSPSHSEMYILLGPSYMRGLIYNVIIGNQVVVRGSEEVQPFVVSLLQMLAYLIPEPCRKMIEYSNSWRDSWECNFLGIRNDVDVPDYVDSTGMILLDIFQRHDVLSFECNGKTPVRTTLGSEIERILTMALPRDLEIESLKVAKEEWINKSKYFYMMSLQLEGAKDPKLKKFMKTLKLSRVDLPSLRFWSSGLRHEFVAWLKKSNTS